MALSRTAYRGFTLIELLVVIAIIGILSSVVLAALGIARFKGADATIKSDLHTLQLGMESWYTDNGRSYGTATACPSSAGQTVAATPGFKDSPAVLNAIRGAVAQGGPGYWAIGVGGQTYSIAIPLKADSGYFWCVDSSGAARRIQSSNFPGGACANVMAGGTATSLCPTS